MIAHSTPGASDSAGLQEVCNFAKAFRIISCHSATALKLGIEDSSIYVELDSTWDLDGGGFCHISGHAKKTTFCWVREHILTAQDLNFSTPILLIMLVGLSQVQITPNSINLQLD